MSLWITNYLWKTNLQIPTRVGLVSNLPVSESVSGSVHLRFAKTRLVEVCCLHRKVMWQGQPLQSCLLQFQLAHLLNGGGIGRSAEK